MNTGKCYVNGCGKTARHYSKAYNLQCCSTHRRDFDLGSRGKCVPLEVPEPVELQEPVICGGSFVLGEDGNWHRLWLLPTYRPVPEAHTGLSGAKEERKG